MKKPINAIVPLLLAVVFFAGCTAPAQVKAQATAQAVAAMGALPIDGIKCEGMEGALVHIHQHLQLFDRGRAIELPANVGIPAGQNCLYWLHTHSNDGLLHEESPVRKIFTLGQFFDIWGMELSWWAAGPVKAAGGKKLIIQVNGHSYKGKDPRAIPLHNHDEIVIQSGPPYARVIKKIKWGSLG